MSRVAVIALVAVLSLAAAVAACRSTQPTNASTPSAQTATAVDANAFTGTVAETMNSGGYTYARLEAAGIDRTRLSVSGYAEFHPIVANDNADQRAQNRRVEIVVLGG